MPKLILAQALFGCLAHSYHAYSRWPFLARILTCIITAAKKWANTHTCTHTHYHRELSHGLNVTFTHLTRMRPVVAVALFVF